MQRLVYWMNRKLTQLTLHVELKDMLAVRYLILELRDTGTCTIMHACLSHRYMKKIKRLLNTQIIAIHVARCLLISCANRLVLCIQYGEVILYIHA